MTLGEKIQVSRKKKGMSQEDLANLLNVSRQAVQKWESNTSKPEIDKLAELSNVFEVSIDWLVKDITPEQEVRKEPQQSQEVTTSQNKSLEAKTTPQMTSARVISLILIFLHFGAIYTIFILLGGFRSLAYAIGYTLIPIIGYYLTYSGKIRRKGTIIFIVIQVISSAGSMVSVTNIGMATLYGLLSSILFISAMLIVCNENGYLKSSSQNTNNKKNTKQTQNTISYEEQARIEEEALKKKEEQEKLNRLRQAQKDAEKYLYNIYHSFMQKKYHPDDKQKVYKVYLDCQKLINECNDYEAIPTILSKFSMLLSIYKIDNEYYEKLKKKRIKVLIVSGIVLAVIGAAVGAGFGVSAAVKENNKSSNYSKAYSLLDDGNYSAAYEQFKDLEGYKDSDQKKKVCDGLVTLEKSITSKDESEIISGIRKIIYGKESVKVTYKLSGDRKTSLLRKSNDTSDYEEVINNTNFKLYVPENETGYSFNRWISTSVSYSDKQASLVLNPIWSYIKYSISYNLDGGENSNKNPTSYIIDSEFTLEPAAKDGYEFLGWYIGDKKTESIEKGTTGDITLDAKWSPCLYELTVTTNNELLGNVSITEGSGYSDEKITIFASATGNNKFFGWYENKELVSIDNPYTFAMPHHNQSLKAGFYTESEWWDYTHGTYPVLNKETNIIKYGLYPQSRVDNTTLIQEIKNNGIIQPSGWYLYDNEYYAVVTANITTTYPVTTFDDGTTINNGSKYYFKAEPIEWLVVENENNIFITTKRLIDISAWDDDSPYYDTSIIREFLNNDFYNSAFKNKDYILTSTIDNSADSIDMMATATYPCDNTEDKVFLMCNRDYPRRGENDKALAFNCIKENLWCLTTEYARAKGASVMLAGENKNTGNFWTRSPYSKTTSGQYYASIVVDTNGYLNGNLASDGKNGLRPCIIIDKNIMCI